jgi:hypothetical protein
MSTVRRGLLTARAEALFASDAPLTMLSREQTEDAITSAVRRWHGVRGCAAAMAGEFGEHPEVAVPRMRWALETVERVYGDAAAEPAEPVGERPALPGWNTPIRALRARVERAADELHTASDSYADWAGLTYEVLPWGTRRYSHPAVDAMLAARPVHQPDRRWAR